MIRRAGPQDRAALVALMEESNGYEAPAARAMIAEFIPRWTFTEADEVWLDEEDGQALGFHQLIPHSEGVLELDLFFTANAAQGRGVGRRLFEQMAERARTLGATAVVISSNPHAADFYRRMGAIDIGVSPPVGAIIWERPKFRLDL
ncbi:MAG: family N-acetyltransferase [Caulobacter sp.]|jgi:GNAT superfamily N-acetyltransferase|nr:family N-acetyltransferase [Caulobacter sp.]